MVILYLDNFGLGWWEEIVLLALYPIVHGESHLDLVSLQDLQHFRGLFAVPRHQRLGRHVADLDVDGIAVDRTPGSNQSGLLDPIVHFRQLEMLGNSPSQTVPTVVKDLEQCPAKKNDENGTERQKKGSISFFLE